MITRNALTRRSFLAVPAALAVASAAAKGGEVPIGLELYSVRDQLNKDLMGTVRAVAKMGYQCVEFYGPYYGWTPTYAMEVRQLLDNLGIQCHSTHNDHGNFASDKIGKAIELNKILGTKYVVMASAGEVSGLDGWKKVADVLSAAVEALKPAGLRPGYHNHKAEFVPLEGKKPIEVIAANTPAEVMLQLDVGTCVEAGCDPVAWINANPGRINSIHLKDWSSDPAIGYKAIFGEGAAPWKQIFAAAESTGGVEFYLIEQESSPDPLEAVEKCLANYRKIHG